MIDRKKVIEDLQYLHDRETWKEGITIFDDHASDRRRITQHALELLKEKACEQRARILTVEDALITINEAILKMNNGNRKSEDFYWWNPVLGIFGYEVDEYGNIKKAE